MKICKVIGLLISIILLNSIFLAYNVKAEILTKQITGYKATSSVRSVNGDSTLGSKEMWIYTGDFNDQETRKTDERTAGTIVSPKGWKYNGGTTTFTELPLSVEYSDADGFKGTLYRDNTEPYYGWDRYKVMGYNGVDSAGETREYTFTKNYPVPGKPGMYYNGCTLEDIGVYSGTVSKTVPDLPPPDPSKPVATINAPTSTHAGNTVTVTGSGTDSKGLAITEYAWTSSNGQSITGTGGNIKVDNSVTLTLKVKNSADVWSDTVSHTISTQNEPPTVAINIPPIVYAGDDIYVSGQGFDNDGDTLSYSWNTPSGTNGTLEGQGGTVYFMDLGIKRFGLTVTDSSGESAYASAQTNVIAPTPTVNIIQSGTLKENRKVIIDTSSSSGGSHRATITTKKYIITALNGSSMNDVKIQTHTVGSTNGTILYDSSKSINVSLDNLSTFDMTFKKAGQYKIDCTIVNNYGKSSTKTITLNVIVDAPPVALLSMPSQFYRDHHDPNKFNGLYYAVIPLTDNGSYSTDGDPIEKIAWFYSFDINNNDTIDDPWYVYNATTNNWDYSVKYTVEQAKNFNLDNYPVGYLQSVNIESAHVGVFYGGILCKEGFGQEYIPQFVTDADKRTSINFDS